jgi:tRNA(Ile)-lysidine synthase
MFFPVSLKIWLTINTLMSSELNRKFSDHLKEKEFFSKTDGILVGVSGGLDSLALLHLLHFGPAFKGLKLVVGHFDHGMRQRSNRDALWVRGLAKSWGIDCEIGQAKTSLSSENDARKARYRFFEKTRISWGLKWVLTAHHADDQAETVLFRILRGTGLLGLKGIPESRSPGIIRPLLPFCRSELESYAEEVGIQSLQDPTNLDTRFARNALRNEILPRIEETVAANARSSLVQLGQIAHESQNAWNSVLRNVYDDLILSSNIDRIVLDRGVFLSFNDSACAIILRDLARQRLDSSLTEAATRAALAFARTSQSGCSFQLGSSVWLHRSFDRFFFGGIKEDQADQSFEIKMPGIGMSNLKLGGKKWHASWSTEIVLQEPLCENFSLEDLVFPLQIRSWEPGDRMRHSYGSKKLKKIFSEKRVSLEKRLQTPIVVDAMGRTIWVPGVSRTSLFVVGKETGRFSISVSNSDEEEDLVVF